MPEYPYKCKKCDYTVDKLKPIDKRDSKEVCPKCKAVMVRKMARVGTIYKTPMI